MLIGAAACLAVAAAPVPSLALANALGGDSTATVAGQTGARKPLPSARWSDPATWGGHLPGASTHVTIDKPILFDVDTQVAGINITARGQLVFDPATSHRLRSSRNIINDGLLAMRPNSPAVEQRIQFVHFSEANFVGGGNEPIASDVGLWTEHGGRLRLFGAPKTAWTNTTGAVPANASVIQVENDAGWAVGDSVAITPTLPPWVPNSSTAYDYATVRAVSGHSVTLSDATTFEHPAVTVAPGHLQTAEVLNLTRNVEIWGQDSNHRSHIWIGNTVPTVQVIDYVDIRFMGPRHANSEGHSDGVLGRYGLHFHDNMMNSVGSVVRGTVIRDTGFHAFVPHMSDGITFTDDVSHNTIDEAFWWDLNGRSNPRVQDPSNGLTWRHCVASLVGVDPWVGGYRLAGFVLGRGSDDVAVGNVAVGIQGNLGASGYNWPEEGNAGQGWLFDGDVAHNNAVNGIFVWHNNSRSHVVNHFVGYYNGRYGIDHGAYINRYVYENSVLYGNRAAGIDLQAVSDTSISGAQLTFDNVLVDGVGRVAFDITTDQHNQSGSSPRTLISNSTLTGSKYAGVGVIFVGSSGQQTAPDVMDFVNDRWSGREFFFNDGVLPASRLRIQDAVHGSIEAAPRGAGLERARVDNGWNAEVRSIPPFAATNGSPGTKSPDPSQRQSSTDSSPMSSPAVAAEDPSQFFCPVVS